MAMVAFPQGFEATPGQKVELSFKTSHPKIPVLKVPVIQMRRPVSPGAPAAAPAKLAPITPAKPPPVPPLVPASR